VLQGNERPNLTIPPVSVSQNRVCGLSNRRAPLNQVWTNLLDKAIDALGERGTITIATRADGSCAVVEIADDGPGIPPEVRDRIFDPFVTTKDVGHVSAAPQRAISAERPR